MSTAASQPQHSHTAERVRLSLTAELLSDANLGSGAGAAGLNSVVARDRRGRPVIWASHLEGLLREAARRRKLDKQAESLFGASGQKRSTCVISSLYCDSKEGWSPRIWRSTARAGFDNCASKDSAAREYVANRAPKDDTLRAIEYVPQGTTFKGYVELPKDAVDTFQKLLLEVDAVGHGRASGSGRIKLAAEAQKPPADTKSRTIDLRGATRWRLLLRNVDPICIGATATPGNLIPTEPYVPGRTLLGALTQWLLDAGERDVAKLMVSERLCIGDALPLPWKDEEPQYPTDQQLASLEVLPAPLSLQAKKPDQHQSDSPWWAERSAPPVRLDAAQRQEQHSNDQQEKLKRPEPDLFVARIDGQWQCYRPEIKARLRNGRPERAKPLDMRKSSDGTEPTITAPNLFAIEQLAEGTSFVAELSGSADELEQVRLALVPVLEGRAWLRLGRAGAPVEVVSAIPLQQHRETSGAKKYLILTSDLLVRDEHLRWRTALPTEPSSIPGWPDGTNLTLKACHEEETPINGFNGTSRLWRLPAAAIRRGSVYRLEGDATKLVDAAARGEALGERIHEGFGRFMVCDELPGVTANSAEQAASSSSAVTISESKPTEQSEPTDEELCRTTREWVTDAGPRPSLSQWFDLVALLEREAAPPKSPGGKAESEPASSRALDERMTPDTAGAQAWKEATEILAKLRALSPKPRARAARFFVRWLCTKRNKTQEELRG